MKQYKITVNGIAYDVAVEDMSNGTVAAQPVYAAVPVQAQPAPQAVTAPAAAPAAAEQPKPAAAAAPAAVPAGATSVSAPMPGTIIKIEVNVGETVKKGQVILVLEAMKMENDIVSPCDGKVVAISVSTGASVNAGELMISIA